LKFLRGEVALLKSEALWRSVLSRPEIAKLEVLSRQRDTHAWLKANLGVESQEKEGTICVWLREGPRSERVGIIEALVNAYLQEAIRRRNAPFERDIAIRASEIPKLRASIASLLKDEAKAKNKEERELHERLRKGEEASIRAVESTIASIQANMRAPYRVSVLRKASLNL
jgi:hypothetical protein